MTSRFETPSIGSTQLRARERLSDNVIVHVMPRGRPICTIVDSAVALNHARASTASQQMYTARGQLPGPWSSTTTKSPAFERSSCEAMTGRVSLRDKFCGGAMGTTYNGNPINCSELTEDIPRSLPYQPNEGTSAQASAFPARSRRKQKHEEKVKAFEIKKAIRREQCRANQARYRSRQLIHQRRLEQVVQRLHEEVQGVKLKREQQCYGKKSNRSPWSIVSEVFQLLQTSFRSPWHMNEMKRHPETRHSLGVLQKSFTRGVAMGELSGVKALLEQLRRCSLYFGDPQLQLHRVEEVVPGVLTASARLGVTVSEFTLQCVFPHLNETKDGEAEEGVDNERRLLREKLLGLRLVCSSTITFLTDEDTGRVVRLETSVDWVGALYRLLRDTGAVTKVLGQALLSAGGAVGDLTDHPGCEREVDAS